MMVIGWALALAACAQAPKTEKTETAATAPERSARSAIHAMAGCYLVDYSYTETDGLKKGYALDRRVYDVNKNKSVKEWIYADDIGDNRIRLQHVLFATDPSGKLVEKSQLKHQAEDWEFGAPFRYEFTGPSRWTPTAPAGSVWTRRITNLDDGLRYQCSSPWKTDTEFPEWACENYAPIPGRETRDMGRKDYNTLQRWTRITVYRDNWLERQENTKTIDENGRRATLAKEVGKNWYVRLPDSDCDVVKGFVEKRRPFWALLRETWDEVLNGRGEFVEKKNQSPPRYAKMMEIEGRYFEKDLNKADVRAEAKAEILRAIDDSRSPKAAR